MLPTLVPWDLLTDFEKQKNRFSSQETLKFLQYNGYKVYRLLFITNYLLINVMILNFIEDKVVP